MSSLGWDVVRHLDAGEDAIERLGGPLPWEIARIRAGDYAPIVRRLEPAFRVGQECVLARSITRAQLVRDGRGRPTGEVIPRQVRPTLVIRVTDILRTARGLWSVPFSVVDRRDPVRMLRRTPPAQDIENAGAEVTPDEEAKARIESSYGASPKQAVDELEAVDDFTLKRFAAEARAIEQVVAQRAHQEAASERRATTSLEKDLADTLAQAERLGIDTTSVRFVTERQIAKLRDRLERAA